MHSEYRSHTQSKLQERTRLIERQPRQAWAQRAGITVTEIAQKVGFDMPFREKLLIAPEAGPAGGKELFVNLRVIETGHRSAIKAQRARGQRLIVDDFTHTGTSIDGARQRPFGRA
jgi:hypothetical protein